MKNTDFKTLIQFAIMLIGGIAIGAILLIAISSSI